MAADIEPGTHVLLRLEHTVSTKTAKAGDFVHLLTASPIVNGGQVIPIGSYARGVITRSERAGRIRGRAQLEFGIVSIMRPDGTVLPVVSSSSSVGQPPDRPERPPSYHRPTPLGYLGVLGGMMAGGIAGQATGSEETAAGVGIGVIVATIVLPLVLVRGSDMELRQGTAIDVVF